MREKFLFFRNVEHRGARTMPARRPEYRVELWRPGMFPWSNYSGRTADLVWWFFHRTGVFANGDFSACMIRVGDRLVHQSSIFPGYFRFPFMGIEDLQIGDTWTDPEHRGLGLAKYAVWFILNNLQRDGRSFWYVVSENNSPSIRVIESCGFYLAGTGIRTPRLGLRVLGVYEVIDQPLRDVHLRHR